MSSKLKDRIERYQAQSDHKLLERLPIVICINGRGFTKVTQLLDKPYCSKLAECLISTMIYICPMIEGALFAYQHNDEIVIIARNDQTNDTSPWFDNKIQKICSATASIATVHFNKCAASLQLDLTGDPAFLSQVFTPPSISEAIQAVVYKQQQNFHTSIQSACLYELLKKYNRDAIKDMLTGLSIDEKVDLLSQECGVDFNSYPISFRRGVACYKVPKVVDGVMKNRWQLNSELPIFAKDQSFLSNLFKNGADIFRQEGFDESR
jgi:tRNA(His) guanylyltransferase